MQDNKGATGVDPHEVRRLAHEMRNHLFIIHMAIESLEDARQDDDRFADLLNKVRRDGVEPLSTSVDSLSNLARKAVP